MKHAMTRRDILRACGVGAAAMALPRVFTARGAEATAKPNIIIILADDYGWGDVGCYGSDVPTPNLDRMAKEGIRFSQFYVGSPICSPSRCAIITGQFPARWNITSYLQTRKGNRECEQADFLDAKAPSLPRALKAAGYATAHIGKWHLGGGRDVQNAPKFAEYGYDLGLGTYESPEPAKPLGLIRTPWEVADEPGQIQRHDRTRWMVDQTLEFLKTHKDAPCFVNLWLDDTHEPWRPSPEQIAAAGGPGKGDAAKRNFRAVLVEMDKHIGRLMDALRSIDAKRETLVLFLGDNGALPTFDQKRNGGLRGSKLSLYEGGTRVPCIAWWPGKVPAGKVNDTTVMSAVDFLPTLCAIAGAAVPGTPDGEDMGDAVRGKLPVRKKPLFWEYGRNDKSFTYPQGNNRSPNVAMREGNWKLLVNTDGTDVQLYDLATDVNETENVAKEQVAVAARMKDAALQWRRSLPKLVSETK